MDDLYAMGPEDVLYRALDVFWRKVQQRCLLQLERSKTEVFTWSGQLPSTTPPDLTVAGSMVDGTFEPGFICYGIPIGTPRYVQHHLRLKVEEVGREVEEVLRVSEGEGQAIWTVARSSFLQKME